MLKLHRLDVSGFKTFVDPVGLEFAGGVTAIVGPNGCGKSNLSDAITWALGEQSAKSLRGESMEDVIFNGSDARKALGMGEVSITLQADAGASWADENGRLTLTRRVYRSGDSQYRLNGKTVRLKDFKDLLMDTGLGIRAYSVIEQGKIGMILSGKPQERRRLLEEAAGITRYKARKRIAEVKLEEATANLLRLEDIVSEVERNLRSLKRQAGAAKRLIEKQEEYRALLRAVLSGRWSVLHGRLEELRHQLERLTSEDAELAASLHREEAELVAGREALDRMARELAERHQRQAELAALIEGRQEYIKASRRTHQEITERLGAGDVQAQERLRQLDEQTQTLAMLDERRGSLAAERDASAAEVAEDQKQIAAAEGAARAAESRQEGLRAQLAAAQGEIARLRNQHHREQLESQKGSVQHRQLGDQLSLFSDQLAESSSLVESTRQRASDLEAEAVGRESELSVATAALEEIRAAESDLIAQERTVDAECTSTRQRGALLEELSAAYEERRHALREAFAAAGIASPSFLGDGLAALVGWEKSLDLYLGELADAVVLPAEDDGLALAEKLVQSRTAGRLLRPVDATLPTVTDAAIVTSLGEALGLAPQMAAALPPAYLVESARDAERLARLHPGIAFLSRERLWAHSGLLHIQGDQAQPGLLARQREAREIAERLPALQASLLEVRGLITAKKEERRAVEARLGQLRTDLGTLRQELAVARARHEDAAKRYHRLSVERETVETERAEVEREMQRVAEREKAVAEELARAEAKAIEVGETFERAQTEASTSRSHREQLRTAGAGRKGRLDLLEERLRAHDQETARARRQHEDARRLHQTWGAESTQLAERREELESGMRRAEAELQEALEIRAGAQDDVLSQQQHLDGERERLHALDEAVQGRRGAREELRGRIQELRVQQAGWKQEGEHLAQQHVEAFQEQPAEQPEPAPENLGELEVDLARCKEHIEKLGPVNVLAGQEYDEQEQRQQFLTTQRADVVQSVESLKKTIREINQTSSQRFLETFNEVNKTFGETFQRLFRGGECEMRLLDEEDLLESGIEIVARPPGKRPQSIMLLSGGEKALTAIALLFALFKSKPSPFCILDEVDAPLDDVNTLRFVDLLRDMAKDTQFLVITHNKLTMEVASTLYGVTMEERGVSKVVSVELEDVQPESRAVSA